MIKIVFVTLMITFILIAGCDSNCVTTQDRNINLTLGDNSNTPTTMGLSNHHNVTFTIQNIGVNVANSVRIYTYYCNDYTWGRECENNTFALRELPPNETITSYFEYDRLPGQDVFGKYSLKYYAESRIPVTLVNNQ